MDPVAVYAAIVATLGLAWQIYLQSRQRHAGREDRALLTLESAAEKALKTAEDVARRHDPYYPPNIAAPKLLSALTPVYTTWWEQGKRIRSRRVRAAYLALDVERWTRSLEDPDLHDSEAVYGLADGMRPALQVLVAALRRSLRSVAQ